MSVGIGFFDFICMMPAAGAGNKERNGNYYEEENENIRINAALHALIGQLCKG